MKCRLGGDAKDAGVRSTAEVDVTHLGSLGEPCGVVYGIWFPRMLLLSLVESSIVRPPPGFKFQGPPRANFGAGTIQNLSRQSHPTVTASHRYPPATQWHRTLYFPLNLNLPASIRPPRKLRKLPKYRPNNSGPVARTQ